MTSFRIFTRITMALLLVLPLAGSAALAADGDQVVLVLDGAPVVDGQHIDEYAPLEAVVSGSHVRTVQFRVDGALVTTERQVPFEVYGGPDKRDPWEAFPQGAADYSVTVVFRSGETATTTRRLVVGSTAPAPVVEMTVDGVAAVDGTEIDQGTAIAVTVDGGAGVESVTMMLNGTTVQVEQDAPYDFFGSNRDTGQLYPDGAAEYRGVVRFTDGSSVTVERTLVVPTGAGAPGSVELLTAGAPLADGDTIAPDAPVEAIVTGLTDVTTVDYYLNGTLVHTERFASYDMWGTGSDRTADELFPAGVNEIHVVATSADGTTAETTVTVTVDAPTTADPTPMASVQLLTAGAPLADGDTIAPDAPVEAIVTGLTDVTTVDYYLNGTLVHTERFASYDMWGTGSDRTADELFPAGVNEIHVVATSADGTTAETTVTVTIDAPTTTVAEADVAILVNGTTAHDSTVTSDPVFTAEPTSVVDTVEWHLDGVLYRDDDLSAPYTLAYNSGSVPLGESFTGPAGNTHLLGDGGHTLTVVLVSGSTTSHQTVSFTVDTGTASTVDSSPPPLAGPPTGDFDPRTWDWAGNTGSRIPATDRTADTTSRDWYDYTDQTSGVDFPNAARVIVKAGGSITDCTFKQARVDGAGAEIGHCEGEPIVATGGGWVHHNYFYNTPDDSIAVMPDPGDAPLVIEYNWAYRDGSLLYDSQGRYIHHDGLQVQRGIDVTIRRNRFEGHYTSAVLIKPDTGRIDNVVVEENWLSNTSGYFALYVRDSGSRPTNVTIRNNYFPDNGANVEADMVFVRSEAERTNPEWIVWHGNYDANGNEVPPPNGYRN